MSEIFPEVTLFPKIKRAAEFIGSLLTPFHESCEPYHSNHYKVDEMLLTENVAGAVCPDEVEEWK